MPPNHTSSQQTFNAKLLDPDALAAPGGLQIVLGSVETICYRDDSSIMEMITGLISCPNILEYTFSSTLHIPVFPMDLMK